VNGLNNSDNLAHEAIARCLTLSRYSEDGGGIRRTFLSPPMRDCHREIAGWLVPLGMNPTLDAVGNLRAIYPGENSGSPRLLIGSHLDTVPNAGGYDGILGVVIAIAILSALESRRLPFAIEVVGFCEEEGVRFGTPFIGSRALIGTVDERLLAVKDAQGISIAHAIKDFGLKPSEIPQAAIQYDVLGYLEFHIEQGPVLANIGQPLAVVEAIAGQSRLKFTFKGRANHAGTTPMDLRQDALAGAAQWISAVENCAQRTPGLVATVGAIQVEPGAGNVIPGDAELSLDVRHRHDTTRNTAVDYLIHEAEQIAKSRGLTVRTILLLDQPAVSMDPFLVSQIAKAIQTTGCEPFSMVSGAGHDAMIMAAKIPSAMIFLRTPLGISHDPEESVEVSDVAKAIQCGVHLLDQLASSADFLSLASSSRTHRA
jgi:allantoate deiminase